MKKFLLASAVLASAVFSACNGHNPQQQNNQTQTMENSVSSIQATPQELDGIKKALDAYIEAALKGDSKIAKPIFAESATISYNDSGKLVSNSIQALFDYYDQTGPHHAEYTVTSAQVADNVAVVSIDSKFGDTCFDDMFSLVKDGDDWKIVSKIYHVR